MDEKPKTNVKPVIRDQGKHQYGTRPFFDDNRSLYNLTQKIISRIFLKKKKLCNIQMCQSKATRTTFGALIWADRQLVYSGALWKMSTYQAIILTSLHKVCSQILPISQNVASGGTAFACLGQRSPSRWFQRQEKYITDLLARPRVPIVKDTGYSDHLLSCGL